MHLVSFKMRKSPRRFFIGVFLLFIFFLCPPLSAEQNQDRQGFDLRSRLTPSGEPLFTEDQLTEISRDLAGMTTFHPLMPWRELGGFRYELGAELQISGLSPKSDFAYGGSEAPSWLGGRLHLMLGLPKKFGAGIMLGALGDLRRGFYTPPGGVSTEVPPSTYTLYGAEVWYDIFSWNKLLLEPNIGARFAVDYARHNRGQLSLINTELGVGTGLRILIVGAYLGLSGILSFPRYSSDLPTKGSSPVANYRITLGSHIALGILRILAEIDWVSLRQMNISAKLALYW
jgi:hypothetical protein